MRASFTAARSGTRRDAVAFETTVESMTSTAAKSLITVTVDTVMRASAAASRP